MKTNTTHEEMPKFTEQDLNENIIMRLKNFRSYGSAEIRIPLNNTTLVSGQSGAGKTTILEAFIYGMYDGVSKPEKFATKKCLVWIFIRDLIIYRQKDPIVFLVWKRIKDTNPNGTVTEVLKQYVGDDGQAVVNSIYGNLKVFLSTSYLRQKEFSPFLSGTDTEKLQIIKDVAFKGAEYDDIKTPIKLKTQQLGEQYTMIKAQLDMAIRAMQNFDLKNPTIVQYQVPENTDDVMNKVKELRMQFYSLDEDFKAAVQREANATVYKQQADSCKAKQNQLLIQQNQINITAIRDKLKELEVKLKEFSDASFDGEKIAKAHIFKQWNNDKSNMSNNETPIVDTMIPIRDQIAEVFLFNKGGNVPDDFVKFVTETKVKLTEVTAAINDINVLLSHAGVKTVEEAKTQLTKTESELTLAQQKETAVRSDLEQATILTEKVRQQNEQVQARAREDLESAKAHAQQELLDSQERERIRNEYQAKKDAFRREQEQIRAEKEKQLRIERERIRVEKQREVDRERERIRTERIKQREQTKETIRQNARLEHQKATDKERERVQKEEARLRSEQDQKRNEQIKKREQQIKQRQEKAKSEVRGEVEKQFKEQMKEELEKNRLTNRMNCPNCNSQLIMGADNKHLEKCLDAPSGIGAMLGQIPGANKPVQPSPSSSSINTSTINTSSINTSTINNTASQSAVPIPPSPQPQMLSGTGRLVDVSLPTTIPTSNTNPLEEALQAIDDFIPIVVPINLPLYIEPVFNDDLQFQVDLEKELDAIQMPIEVGGENTNPSNNGNNSLLIPLEINNGIPEPVYPAPKPAFIPREPLIFPVIEIPRITADDLAKITSQVASLLNTRDKFASVVRDCTAKLQVLTVLGQVKVQDGLGCLHHINKYLELHASLLNIRNLLTEHEKKRPEEIKEKVADLAEKTKIDQEKAQLDKQIEFYNQIARDITNEESNHKYFTQLMMDVIAQGQNKSSSAEIEKTKARIQSIIDQLMMLSSATQLIGERTVLEKTMREKAATAQDIERQHMAAQKLLVKATEAERIYLQTAVDRINVLLGKSLQKLFPDVPISVQINTTKELKTKGRGGVQKYSQRFDIKIFYRDSEYDGASQLSGGERDRVSLAITLAMSETFGSPILFLDETLSSLDSELKSEAVALLKDMCKTKTCVVISHEETEGLYDNVLRLKSD